MKRSMMMTNKNPKELNPVQTRKAVKNPSPASYIREAYRYLTNARKRLKEARIEYNRYQDVKPVREACGTCYLAVLLAIDAYLLHRGVSSKQYIPMDGKLTNAFSNAYEILHIFGYYRGGASVDMVKAGFQNAKFVIDTLAKFVPS